MDLSKIGSSTRQVLRSKICGRSNWISDAQQDNCFSCNIKFIKLFRNRHHCRKCGNVFCKRCCDSFINGKNIHSSLEKSLRLCNNCLKQIKDFVIKNEKKHLQSNAQQPEFSLKPFRIQTHTEHQSVIQRLQKLFDYFIEKRNLHNRWMVFFHQNILKALIQIRTDNTISGGSMDPNSYLRIKRIKSSEKTSYSFIRGLVYRKRAALKHMRTDIRNPKVLLITGALQLPINQDPDFTFQDIVQNEKKYIQRIVNRLQRFGPNVIFTEKGANILALDMLLQKKITLVTNNSTQIIQKIKRICKIKKKIVRLDKLDDYEVDQVIGSANRLQFVDFVFKEDQTQPWITTIMFLHNDNCNNQLNICLQGSDFGELTLAKEITCLLLRLGRIIYYQKSMLQLQDQLLKKINFPMSQSTLFKNFMIDTKGIQRFACQLTNQLIRVDLVNSTLAFEDIKKDRLQNYYAANNFFTKIPKVFSLPCKPAYAVVIPYYSAEDFSLGKLLVEMQQSSELKCQICNKPFYYHSSLYIRGDRYVFVQSSTKISAFGTKQPQLTIDSDSKLKHNIDIKYYIKCRTCGQILSDQVSFSRKDIQYSFGYWLNQLLSFQLQQQTVQEKRCLHSLKSRVLNFQNIEMQFSVGKVQIYKIKTLSLIEHAQQMDKLNKSYLKALIMTYDQGLSKSIQDFRDELNQLKLKQQSQQSIIRSLKNLNQSMLQSVEQIKYKVHQGPLQQLKNIHNIFWLLVDTKQQFRQLLQQPKLKNKISEQKKDEDQIDKLCKGLIRNQSYKIYSPLYETSPLSFLTQALAIVLSDPQQYMVECKPIIRIKIYPEAVLNQQASVPQKGDKEQMGEVVIHYLQDFENLRVLAGISLNDFVEKLLGVDSWSNSGGKSGSSFSKSQDNALIFKCVNQKQFSYFKKYIKDYVNFILKNPKSVLARIYGMFEITVKGKTYHYIVMQNLFYGLSGKLKVYDLKGSLTNRTVMPDDPTKNFTGLDTNFKLDRFGEPLSLKSEQHFAFIQVLNKDAQFLSNCQVIDYSLLLIIELEFKAIRVGIIDFMRPYQMGQVLQSVFKGAIKNQKPTVIAPAEYAKRFIISMQQYFMGIP